MFKKIFIVMFVALLASMSVFAASMQIGVTGRFGGSDITAFEDYKNPENYRYGGDVRFNFGVLNLSGKALFGAVNENNTEIIGSIIGNFRVDLGLLDFSLGAGYELPFEVGAEGIIIDGEYVTQAVDVFNRSTLFGHVGVGLNLGNLGIAADYHLTYDSIMKMVDDYDNVGVEPMKEGWVSISVLCKVF